MQLTVLLKLHRVGMLRPKLEDGTHFAWRKPQCSGRNRPTFQPSPELPQQYELILDDEGYFKLLDTASYKDKFGAAPGCPNHVLLLS